MPLPYAPPPKDSKVYRDLKNLKISAVTSDQMDTLKGELYAQGTDGSEDEMRRLQLLGMVSNQASASGPIPGTQVIKTVTVTSGSVAILFQPDPGEVWLWLNWSGSTSGQGGASINHYTYLSDGSVNDYLSVTSTSSTTPKATTPNSAIYVTNEVYASVQSNISTGSVVWLGSFIRVR